LACPKRASTENLAEEKSVLLRKLELAKEQGKVRIVQNVGLSL
jgi:hypothetical protein